MLTPYRALVRNRPPWRQHLGLITEPRHAYDEAFIAKLGFDRWQEWTAYLSYSRRRDVAAEALRRVAAQ